MNFCDGLKIFFLFQSKSLVDELIDFRLEYTSYRRLCITRRPEPRYEVHPIGEETPDYGPELVPIFDKEIPPTPAPSVATLILDPPTEEEKARGTSNLRLIENLTPIPLQIGCVRNCQNSVTTKRALQN